MAYFYTAYGLIIRSAFCLPELEPQLVPADRADADVIIGSDQDDPAAGATNNRDRYPALNTVQLVYPHVGTFLIRHGRDVRVSLIPNYDAVMLATLLTGIIMAVVLVQRGLIVLHASAIAIHGHAVAFLGNKGAGKSVMASRLYQRGHTLLTDDLTVIDAHTVPLMVLPAPPRFKLWPDAVESLGGNLDTLPCVHPALTKRLWQVAQDSTLVRYPLQRLYVLAEGPALRMVQLPAVVAFIEIVRHSYAARWMTTPDQDHFQQCTILTSQVEIYRLERPRQFALLPDVMRLLEETHGAHSCR